MDNISTSMSKQLQLLKQEVTVSQILRNYGSNFTQIRKRYSDGRNGRCAIGVIMSYFGWNGKDDGEASTEKIIGNISCVKTSRYQQRIANRNE